MYIGLYRYFIYKMWNFSDYSSSLFRSLPITSKREDPKANDHLSYFLAVRNSNGPRSSLLAVIKTVPNSLRSLNRLYAFTAIQVL